MIGSVFIVTQFQGQVKIYLGFDIDSINEQIRISLVFSTKCYKKPHQIVRGQRVML
jgi:hypothetical protein